MNSAGERTSLPRWAWVVLAFLVGFGSYGILQHTLLASDVLSVGQPLSRLLSVDGPLPLASQEEEGLIGGCPFTENRVIATEEAQAGRFKLRLSKEHQHLAPLPDEIGSLKAAKLLEVEHMDAVKHCLPMSVRECHTGTMEMLIRDTPVLQGEDGTRTPVPGSSKEAPLCKSSVLHLLLEEMWMALHETGCQSQLMHGTLLGAIREQAIIPHTPDIDVGYFPETCNETELAERAWKKGLLTFWRGIYSWCIAAHHPLAPYLYDPSFPTSFGPMGPKDRKVPYGDFYKIEAVNEEETLFTVKVGWKKGNFARDKMFPTRCARVFNNEYPVMNDSHWWLAKRYGESYRVSDHDQLRDETDARAAVAELHHKAVGREILLKYVLPFSLIIAAISAYAYTTLRTKERGTPYQSIPASPRVSERT